MAYSSYLLIKMSSEPGQQDSSEVEQDLSEQSCSWKSKLSAALNDEQVFFSLLLLGIFYVGYTAAKADFDANDTSIDDDERFIQSCYCSLHQRSFYRSWFILFCAIWFIIHTYAFLAQFQILTNKCQNCGNIITGILAACSVLLECFCCVCPCRKDDDGGPSVGQNQLAIKGLVSTEKLESNIRMLWFQYCKLYVTGYAKDDEKIGIVSKARENNEDQRDSGKHYFPSAHILKGVIRAFLFFIKYLSQLVTVPLLLLQMFDTYSLLCFSPDLYCSNTSEYKLHLAQAAITLLFYCNLALSQLTSTMLAWNPWPEDMHT